LADPRYQRAAPATAAARETEPPGRRAGSRLATPAAPLDVPAAVDPLIFWIFCAVMVILLLVWAVPPLAQRLRRRQPAVKGDPPARPAPSGLREEPLADALELAGQGRYAEAV